MQPESLPPGVIVTYSDGGQLRECKSCRSQFELSAGQLTFYAQRDLSAPRRCTACRRFRREQAQQEVA